MFEYAMALQVTPLSTALLERVRDASRAEAQAAAERLVAVADLYQARLRDSGERADFAIDTYAAVAAQVAATLRVSTRLGSSYLKNALAMRERLPKVGAIFEAGDIDYRAFQTIVFRTGLVNDDELMAKLDADLAVAAPRWRKSRSELAAAIDKRIAHRDPDAVRRAKDVIVDRYVVIGESDAGMAEVQARTFNTTGIALDKRLDELASTVCDSDPRTMDQRRADALDSLIAGADQLVCACGQDICPATSKRKPPGNLVMHVVAEKAALEGRSEAPGYMPGADSLIPAQVLRELAAAAKHLPIIPPVTAAPEAGYVPTRALADFVRCRDLTCRAPGCSKPAVQCEIDHTIPYPFGPTQAANLKCLCVEHHILKTFLGWRDEQLPDGTVIWTLPGGQKEVTTPGSALLFPSLCFPTAKLPPLGRGSRFWATPDSDKMPRRTKSRASARADAIAAERNHNRKLREGALVGDDGEDPPPF
ncbi:HNH endonuclease signature motif containing protein [soil metagenome]